MFEDIQQLILKIFIYLKYRYVVLSREMHVDSFVYFSVLKVI
jgi:hypothetical protein